MATTNLKPTAETESERIERWRRETLERVGYATSDAAELALRLDVDLHAALGLVKRGCPPDVAAKILL
jgi:hypothetical protein